MNFINNGQKKVAIAKKTVRNAMTHKSYRQLVINFLLLTATLTVVILYFALAQAIILLTPSTEEFKHQMTIGVLTDRQTSAPDKAVSGTMATTTVALEQKFSATSGKEIESVAVGEITIYNKTSNRKQLLVATTQFINDAGQIVRIKDTITSNPGETLTVSAFADKPGLIGEVSPGKFQILKLKSARDQIYGEVKTRFIGGTKVEKIISENDLTSARSEMEQKLKVSGQEKLSATAGQAFSSNDIAVSISKYETNAKAGDKKSEFTVKAEALAMVFIFDKEAAKQIIKTDLTNNLPTDKTLIDFDENSFTVALDKDNQFLNAKITAHILAKLSASTFNKKAIYGKSREEAQNYFMQLPGVKQVFVELKPYWVRSVPKNEDHIKIEVK